MTDTAVIEIAVQMMVVVAKVSAPILLTSLGVGLAISLFQSVTQIQEVTLTFAPHVSANFDTPSLIGAISVQVAVGLVLGFLANLLMSALQTAGSLIDLFGGFTISQAYDPMSNNQSAMFGRIYQLLMVTLLFA